MKFLKWVLIILLVMAGLILIIPIFLPSQVTVTSKIEINVPPEAIFHQTALFTDRPDWDPWLTMEPDAEVAIKSKKGYVGSTYEWNGEKIGNGKMQVDSVHYPNYIASKIWFGGNPEPSLVEWILNENNGGTDVLWQFTSEGSYPFGRWMLLFMKGPLGSAFKSGLDNYKAVLEADPPKLYKLSDITIQKSYDTYALVIAASGTMDEIAAQMQTKFPLLGQEIANQGLEPNGPAFAHYLDYDPVAGTSNALLAIPVKTEGKETGDIRSKFYPAMETVTATHYGSYEYFQASYDAISEYIEANNLEITGEAFELYMKSMMDSDNPMDWETIIGFPLK